LHHTIVDVLKQNTPGKKTGESEILCNKRSLSLSTVSIPLCLTGLLEALSILGTACIEAFSSAISTIG